MIVPLALVWSLGHALYAAQGARRRRLGRLALYEKAGRGKGPPVLLVHGLGGNSYSWAPLLGPLARVSRRIVLLDLPGHGASPVDADLSHVDQISDAVSLALDDLGEPALLVGNSLGGAATLHAAALRPERVAGWAGLAPAGAPLTDAERCDLEASFASGVPAAKALLARLYFRVPRSSWLVLRDLGRHWGSPGLRALLDEALRLSPELAPVRVPSLVLWGEADRLLPMSSVGWFRQKLGASAVEIVPRCGHLPQIEQPRLVADRLVKFSAALMR